MALKNGGSVVKYIKLIRETKNKWRSDEYNVQALPSEIIAVFAEKFWWEP